MANTQITSRAAEAHHASRKVIASGSLSRAADDRFQGHGAPHLRMLEGSVQRQERRLQGACGAGGAPLVQQVLLKVLRCIVCSLGPSVAIKDPCRAYHV